MKVKFKIFAMGLLFAGFNIIPEPSALDIVKVVAMAKKGISIDPSAAAAAAAAAAKSGAPVTPAPYPTNNIFATPLQLSAGQTLTELNYYIGFQDGSVTALEIQSSGVTSSFLASVNASIAQGNVVIFTASATANGTGYDAVASAYVLNTTTPIASYSFPSITNWPLYESGHVNSNVAILNANNSINRIWVKYVTATPTISSTYLSIYPSTGYQIQLTTAVPAASQEQVVINPISSKALQILEVVAMAKGLKVNPSAAPAITPGKTVVAPNVASPLTQLWMSPCWTNAPGNTGQAYAECAVVAPLLTAINAALAQGVSVSVCPVFAVSTTKTGYSDLIITAYNQSTQQVIGSPQVCPGIMQSNNTWTYSNVTYQLNTPGSTAVVVGGVAIYQAFGITSSAPVSAPAITPGKTVVAPNVASPLTQLWMSPCWTNAPGNTGQAYAECAVVAPLLTAINAALAQGVSVSVCPVFAVSTTKTGYSDLIITAYNQSTQQVIGSPQVCPGIMQSNNTWTYSNVTYQLNTPGSTAVVVGGVAINQAFGITSSTPVSAPAITPGKTVVAPPTNLFTNPNPPLQAGQTITSFTVSPNFSNGMSAEITIDEKTLSVTGPTCLSQIPLNTPIAFAFQTVPNTQTGGFDATVTGYVYGSRVPLFTYFEPSITNASATGGAGMIPSVNNTCKTYLYNYNLSGDATDHSGNMQSASVNGFYFPAAPAAAATPVALTPAPYPTGNIFATPLTLQVAQILTELNYYFGFNDNSVSALMINSSGPAASFLTAVNASIAQGNVVIFTASATANGTGYDAVASAYVLNTTTPIASYSFPSITNWSTSASGHTNTNVAILNANNPVNASWVKYVTANPPVTSGYLPINSSRGYQIQSTAAGNVDINTSEHGNYQDFLNTLNNSPIMISSGLQVDKNIVVAIAPSAGQYNPTEITLGGYTLFGPTSTFSESLLAPYLANVSWTNPSDGVIFALIEFDSANNSIADLTKAAATDSIYLFLFDLVTGDSLTTAGIPVPTSSGPFKPLTNPFNATGENGFINVDATYPATFILQLASPQNQQGGDW